MGVALGFGITGAVVVLLGTALLSGSQWRCLRRPFFRMCRRFGAIDKGLGILSGDQKSPRFLKEGEPGFQEILKIIAKQQGIERAGVSAIRCGAVAGEGSLVREQVAVCRGTSSSPQRDKVGTREAVEQWIRDDRARSRFCLGFVIVCCGVVLGLTPDIMQAIGSEKC